MLQELASALTSILSLTGKRSVGSMFLRCLIATSVLLTELHSGEWQPRQMLLFATVLSNFSTSKGKATMDATEAYAKLIEMLVGLDFDTRYFSFFEATKQSRASSKLQPVDVVSLFDKLPIPFRLNKKESFFFHRAETDYQLGI